ncbi:MULTISPECIES: site-specific integrase [unclassified Enterococcus]|uniref:site-specific integrase n=1 Tax=unclassified Enterococcus TaxID=2608891 RepID=UPI0019066A69|nr:MULTISPECIES: tyrosine-type recombinase/integrase [unclassified Enterococcus]MBK0037501.1 site-specific integrase [Enterococcus sp. S52]MBK0070374.1 site-specific integrase [Enterococcus sp. S53]MBK0141214.1 site-specific integrase [Enterococcus sp. S76]MBK0144602.1 site-specific integrase [Enterococcus sp. S77]
MVKENIKKAKNGTYYFRAFLGIDQLTGKLIQKYRSGFKTQKEAKKAYAELLVNVESNVRDSSKREGISKMNFKAYIEQVFLPYYKTRVEIRTFENRQSSILKHFPFFYHLNVDEITPINVQTWQSKMAETLSRSYVRVVQGIFSVAMDRAVVLGLSQRNPSKIVGNVKKEKKVVDFWTKEEFEKVIANIYIGDYYQRFVFTTLWLLFMSGLRIGEATALQWSDVDYESGILSVTKSLYYKNVDEFYFTEPKTKASIRYIPLDDITLGYLKKWEEEQQRVLETDFILSYNGFPTQKHTISYAIDRYAKLAGVHRIRIHALRHSHASLLISLGENAIVIKDRLGHEDIETTLGTYGHLYPNSNFQVAKKLNGIMNVISPDENKGPNISNQYTAEYLKLSR